MANIGYATLTVMPSMRGAQANLAKELGGLSKSGDSVGQSVGSKIGGGIRKTLKAGVLAVGAAAGGALGTALFKGFGRLTKVENATAKLTGLGHSAKSVKSIMDNALESVKGTAFGLDEAASTAAGAVASGVKPGKDLTRTLKLVGDAATIGGSSMSEMGSIFNKVAASGKLQGDVIAQLGDRGIPILQLLGKQLNKTPAEVAKLASKGKVDFATFQKAMEDGLGGAALKSGDTFQGALANMQAALGRVGAKLLGGVFPQMKNVFGDATSALDNLGPMAEKAGALIGKGFSFAYTHVKTLATGVGALFNLFVKGDYTGGLSKVFGLEEDSRIVDVILRVRDAISGTIALLGKGDYNGGLSRAFGLEEDSPIIDKILNIRDALKGLMSGGLGNLNLSALGGLGAILGTVAVKAGALMPFIKGLAPKITKLASVFRFLTGPVGIVLTLFGAAYASSAAFRDAVNGLLSVLGNLVGDLASALLPVFQQLVTSLLPVAQNLFASLVPIITQIVAALAPMISQIAATLIPVLTQIITSVLPVFNALLAAIIPIVLQLVQAVLPPLLQTLAMVAPLLQTILPVIGSLVSMIASLLIPIIQALQPVVQTVFAFIASTIQTALAIIQAVISTVMAAVRGDWGAVWEGIKGIAAAVWNHLQGLVSGAINVIKSVISGGINIVKTVWSAAWDAVREKVKTAIVTVLQILGALPGQITGLFSSAGTLLVSAGQNIVQGLWNGISSLGGWIKDKVVGFIANVIPGPIRKALGIASPSKVTKALGKWVGVGLAEGMTGTAKQVAAASTKLASNISKPLQRQVADEVRSLKTLAGQREAVAKRLKDAQKALADAAKTRTDLFNNLNQSIMDSGKLEGGSAEAIIAKLGNDVRAAKMFGANLAKLRRMGLSDAAYKQLVEAGVEGGGQTAAALAAGGKAAVAKVNTLMSQLSSTAKTVAYKASTVLYQAGVDSARGLVAGLESQSKALEGAAKKIANSLTAQVKKQLGIRSPSRVFAGVGEQIPAGLIVGMTSRQGELDRAVTSLVQTPVIKSPGTLGSASGQASPADVAAAVRQGVREGLESFKVALQIGDREFASAVMRAQQYATAKGA